MIRPIAIVPLMANLLAAESRDSAELLNEPFAAALRPPDVPPLRHVDLELPELPTYLEARPWIAVSPPQVWVPYVRAQQFWDDGADRDAHLAVQESIRRRKACAALIGCTSQAA